LPYDLEFNAINRYLTQVAGNIQPIVHHLDNRAAVLMDKLRDIQRIFLGIGLNRLDPASLSVDASWRLPHVNTVGMGKAPKRSNSFCSLFTFTRLYAIYPFIMAINLRDVYPTKYYSKEGFVETKFEINDEDLQEIIEEYLLRHADFDIDEVEIVNNRPMNIWLYALCRKYIDPDDPNDKALDQAEVEVKGDYDGNPTVR